MKARKLIFVITVFFVIFSSLIFTGTSLKNKRLTFTISDENQVVYSKTFECTRLATVRLSLFYGGDVNALYEKRYLGSPISLLGFLNPDIYPSVKEYLGTCDECAVEPYAVFDGGEKFTYYGGKNGKKVDEHDVLVSLIKTQKAELNYTTVYPKNTLESVKKDTTLIAKFTTDYTLSPVERQTNIAVAVQKLDGAVVQSGEKFSFNSRVGARTEENGFLPSKVIVYGEYALGVGGGVCQVSTTLYNAWLLAGLDSEFSRCHSLAPSYVTRGFDAMVSDSTDLVLYNCTNYPIYIGATAKNGFLTVKIFSHPIYHEVKLVSELVKVIECTEYDEVEEEIPTVFPKNGEIYHSFREFFVDKQLVMREPLRLSTYLPQKGKKSRIEIAKT